MTGPQTPEQRIEQLERQITKLEALFDQRIANLEIELLYPLAEAEMPTGQKVKRMTIRGAMEKLYNQVFPEQSGLKLPKPRLHIPH
jgi:hypothetical protein